VHLMGGPRVFAETTLIARNSVGTCAKVVFSHKFSVVFEILDDIVAGLSPLFMVRCNPNPPRSMLGVHRSLAS